MNFIVSIVFFFLGLGMTSFTVLPVLIILFFGIPFTRTLETRKILYPNNGIVKRYLLITVPFLAVIFLVTLYITSTFFSNGLVGFLVGVGAVVLLGLGKTGENDNNVRDYFETNKKYLNNKNLDKLYNKLSSK